MTLIVIVVLIAWFFGISYGAALHGILNFVVWAVAIGAVLCAINSFLEPSTTTIGNIAPKHQKSPKPPKEYPLLGKIAGWAAFFVASYLITDLFFIIIGLWENSRASLAQLVLMFLLPALPFSMVVAYRLGRILLAKKRVQKKTR